MASRSLTVLSSSLSQKFTSFNPYGLRGRDNVTATTLKNYPARIQFERLAHDISMWREAIREAEMSFYPSRVRMNRMYMDVIENPVIKPYIDRWFELTMQRDYQIYQIKGDKKIVSKDLSQQASEQYWLGDYIYRVSESILHGYNLIAMGDIDNDGFPQLDIVPRENIIPDGNRGPILTSLVYAVNGIEVTDDPMIDMFNHWIPTKSNRGVQACGYGLLYPLSQLEIHLRHILEWNMDYAEMFGQPIKKGTTRKKGKDLDAFEAWLANSGSNSWVLLDPGTDDDISYEQAQSAGTAWKTYDNVEMRLEKKVAQLMLGHSDAIISQPGKLGGNQNSNKEGNNINLIQSAMNAKQVTIGNFVHRVMNQISIPRFRRIGKYVGSKIIENTVPIGYNFGLQNDTEENEIQRRKSDHWTKTSIWVKNLNDSGWNVKQDQLEDITGLQLEPGSPERTLIEKREVKTETVNDK